MLKKFYVTALSIILIMFLTILNNPPAFFSYSQSRTVYTGTSSTSVFEEYSQYAVVNKAKGESCVLPISEFNLDEIIKYFCAEKVITERINGTVSYYFISPKLKTCENIKGKKVNLHIAINNEYAVLGTPIIYGGY